MFLCCPLLGAETLLLHHLQKATQQEVVLDTAKVLFSAFTQEERPGPLKKGEREKDYEFDEFKGPILPAQQISYRRMFKFKKNKLKISM